MGCLWACTQTVLGLIYGHTQSRIVRVFLLLVLVLTILVVGGLASYRALLLASGEEIAAPTVWDQLIVRFGPWLAAAIGLIFPIAETFAGYFSFNQWVEPMIRAAVSWIAGLTVLLWSALAWWLCGFHPVPPELTSEALLTVPPAVRILRRLITRMENRMKDVQKKNAALGRRLANCPDSTGPVHLREEIVRRKKEMETFWAERITAMESSLATARSPRDLGVISSSLRDIEVLVANNYRQLKNDIRSARGRILQLFRQARSWKRCGRKLLARHEAIDKETKARLKNGHRESVAPAPVQNGVAYHLPTTTRFHHHGGADSCDYSLYPAEEQVARPYSE